MECDICGNLHAADHAFVCPACARAALYSLRVDHARLLLDKEKIRNRVESAIHGTTISQDQSSSSYVSSDQDVEKRWAHESNLAEIRKGQERIDGIVKKSRDLQYRIDHYRDQIEKRKAEALQRKQSNDVAAIQFSAAGPGALETNKKSVRRKTLRYENLTQDIIAARTFLCKEAATLAGLQRYQRKTPQGITQESFVLNGLPVVDLRDLNDTHPHRVTASLSNVARLLVQTCYYLGVRLPAEITLPKENYFQATIYSPSSSYLINKAEISIPGVTSSNSSSPSASRTIDQHSQTSTPRPRPLFLNKKLTVLMRDHPSQYSHFVEGVSLLAWDVAWLCRLQGLPIANTDWEEICAIGRNLWLLLINQTTVAQNQHLQQQQQQQQQQQLDDQEGRQKPSRKSTGPGTGTATQQAVSTSPSPDRRSSTSTTQSTFAYRSHSTSYTPPPPPASGQTPSAQTGNTGQSIPVDVTARAWKFASPLRLADNLRAHLLNDASGADWEVLSSGEFEGWIATDATKVDEDPVVIPGSTKPRDATLPRRERGNVAEGHAATVAAPHETTTDPAAAADQKSEGRARPADGESAEDSPAEQALAANAQARPRGTSGWTKLKSRSGSNT